MSLNSINTNIASYVALQSLNNTNSALQNVQKQISTGYRVADATDDGAAYAIAQRVRSDVSALTVANQQLGAAKGLVTTTVSTLNDVSTLVSQTGGLRDTLTKLAAGTTIGDARTQDIALYKSQLAGIKAHFQDSSYNGKTLIGNITGSIGTFGASQLVRNEQGSTFGVATFSGSAFLASLTFTGTQLGGAASVSALLTGTGAVLNNISKLGTQLNYYGTSSNYIDNQVTFNSDKIDSLNSGLGSLVDADLSKEAAQLQSLQIKQQLGTQALSIANQAPSSLISLFK